MKNKTINSEKLRTLIDECGMLIVLLLLIVLASCFTYREQYRVGDAGGREVAKRIIDEHGTDANVILIGRDNEEEKEFTAAAKAVLTAQGVKVLAVVNGSPADARGAIESAVGNNETITAIGVTKFTHEWTIYDQFPEVGREKCVEAMPYYWPTFLKTSNLIGVANQTAIYAIIAIGMTLVIITAGIDLSVGSLVALASVSTALFIREAGSTEAGWIMVALAMMAGISVCALAGAVNGAFITWLRLPPFIVTLAMMLAAEGTAFRVSQGKSIPAMPDSLRFIGAGEVIGVPVPVILMLGLYILAYFIMSWTVFGRYVYAIGGNREAARLAGAPIKRVLFSVYIISGALAGLGGLILTSRLDAGDPKFGKMYELEVIAAVVVGGTSLMGGQGKITGTLIGAFIIAVIKNGMNLLSVDSFNQKIVLGGVLLLAVTIDKLRRK